MSDTSVEARPAVAPAPDHTPNEQAPMVGEVAPPNAPWTPQDADRLAVLRSMEVPAMTQAETDEMNALQDREPPPLLPLTPHEIGRLAELRATPTMSVDESKEMASLATREYVPQPPPPPAKPDPEKVPGLTLDVMGGVIGMIERIVGSVPQLHAMQGTVAALRQTYQDLYFNATPPVEMPPPQGDAVPNQSTERGRRIAELEQMEIRSIAQELMR